MCGACGTSGAGHWSAPFLASPAARSAAAAAVTAMASGRFPVSASPGGYLVSTATGRRQVAADLGAVWEVVAPADLPDRIGAGPPRLPGVITVPPARPALTSIVLLVVNSAGEHPRRRASGIDGREMSPMHLTAELRRIVDAERPAEIVVGLSPAQLEPVVGALRAHPARPFAVTEIHDAESVVADRRESVPGGDFDGRLPALIAWLAALDRAEDRCELQLRIPLKLSQTLAVDVLRGIVTRCELLPPRAASSSGWAP